MCDCENNITKGTKINTKQAYKDHMEIQGSKFSDNNFLIQSNQRSQKPFRITSPGHCNRKFTLIHLFGPHVHCCYPVTFVAVCGPTTCH